MDEVFISKNRSRRENKSSRQKIILQAKDNRQAKDNGQREGQIDREGQMERLVSKGKSQKEVILFKYMIFKRGINKLMIEKNENQIQNI